MGLSSGSPSKGPGTGGGPKVGGTTGGERESRNLRRLKKSEFVPKNFGNYLVGSYFIISTKNQIILSIEAM